MKKILFFVPIIILNLSSISISENPIIFGVVSSKIDKYVVSDAYKPLMDFLSDRLNYPVVLDVFKSYGELIENIEKKNVDFCILSPETYIQSQKKTSDIKYLASSQKKNSHGVLTDHYMLNSVEIPYDICAASPNVKEELYTTLQAALVNFSKYKKYQKQNTSNICPKGFVIRENSFYDIIRDKK